MIVVNSRFLSKEMAGVVRYASEITPHIKNLCKETIFVSHKGIIQNDLSNILGAIEVGKLKGYLWEQLELPLFLKKLGNPILLNLCNTGPCFYKDQITVIHDVAFIKDPSWYTRKAALAFKVIISRAAKVSKRIITLSEFTKREVMQYLEIPSEKIEVVPGAVPQIIVSLSKKEYENNFGKYILTVSTLQPRKNISSLIKAFNLLSENNLKLVIAGSGNERVFPDPYINHNNSNIILTGYINDMELTALYKNAALFVYPSYYEGFGFPPLEAMTCGCPVLVSNNSSLPEICGDHVYYFNPADNNNLVEELKKLLNGVNNLSRSEYKFNGNGHSWEKSAESILDFIKKEI